MKIYGDTQSGNCYKIKLKCSLLGKEYEWVHTDILAGDVSKDSYLRKNPCGKIPLLELSDGRTLSESNAIINYLAFKSHLLPTDQFDFAKVEQWQFFKQYSHETYIAMARFIAKYFGLPDNLKEKYEAKQAGGHKSLSVMEKQLATTPFLIGDSITTADISLYAYTHVAPEGGFDLTPYPTIMKWIEKIKSLPKCREM
ncbi:glutathione S-transferase family protein [Billgrantia sp. Q4P2]|uniref:glutathione S-transferase family protein n=1 Tax=Billgrantia sp. Q4P2 TaxID=3463857 RepID=UPI0040578026